MFQGRDDFEPLMDGFMKNKVNLLDEANKVSQTARDEGNELRNLLSKRLQNRTLTRSCSNPCYQS